MIYYGINTLFSLRLPWRSLLHNDDLYTILNSIYKYCELKFNTDCMEGFKNALKAFISFNRYSGIEGTGAKIPGFGIRISSLRNEPTVYKTLLDSSPI